MAPDAHCLKVHVLTNVCRSQYGVGVTYSVLSGWAAWAEERNLAPHLKSLAMGPNSMKVDAYDRAMVKGVTFTASRLETKNKAKNSIIMIEDTGKTQSGNRAFGNVKRFIQVKHVRWERAVQLVDAEWFKGNEMNTVINCPVVEKEFLATKSLWFASTILPVSVALVPYYTRQNVLNRSKWQVLASSPDFLLLT